MTNTPPPPPAGDPTPPVTPTPAAGATGPAITPPSAGATPSYATPGAGGAAPKQTLSLTSFIVGLAAFVFSWVAVLGLLAGIVAIILGVMGRRREPGAPKWMAIVGIIAGSIAVLIGLIVLIFWILAIAFTASVPNYTY